MRSASERFPRPACDVPGKRTRPMSPDCTAGSAGRNGLDWIMCFPLSVMCPSTPEVGIGFVVFLVLGDADDKAAQQLAGRIGRDRRRDQAGMFACQLVNGAFDLSVEP